MDRAFFTAIRATVTFKEYLPGAIRLLLFLAHWRPHRWSVWMVQKLLVTAAVQPARARARTHTHTHTHTHTQTAGKIILFSDATDNKVFQPSAV